MIEGIIVMIAVLLYFLGVALNRNGKEKEFSNFGNEIVDDWIKVLLVEYLDKIIDKKDKFPDELRNEKAFERMMELANDEQRKKILFNLELFK